MSQKLLKFSSFNILSIEFLFQAIAPLTLLNSRGRPITEAQPSRPKKALALLEVRLKKTIASYNSLKLEEQTLRSILKVLISISHHWGPSLNMINEMWDFLQKKLDSPFRVNLSMSDVAILPK